jgi:cytochrome c-type biogenesis protein CcmE
MNPTRKRRLALIGVLLAAACAAGAFIVLALQENLSYLHTPSEVRQGKAPPQARFRLGGIVCEGSVHRTTGSLEVDFAVTDRVRQVPVRFNGILPDMFKEGTAIIAVGNMEGGNFVASEVLAKHDESYRPREVEQAMMAQAAKSGTAKSCGAN